MSKKKIDDAILTLEVLIDCCKEDGTTYNAIKEWEALEVFKDLANRINKAIKYIKENEEEYGSLEDNEKIILEILRGESNE